MPFFRKPKRARARKSNGGSADTSNPPSRSGAGDPPTAAPSLPATTSTKCCVSSTSKGPVFDVNLAQGGPPGKVEGFADVMELDVKELYEKIGEAFNMPADEILFCTVNTFKVDMDKLLGDHLDSSDQIYAHIKGQKYEIAVKRNESALGLIITDNGAGLVFVKRIRDGSVVSQNEHIAVGDHIVMINGQNMVGCGHLEVVKVLKGLPVGKTFTMKLWKPLKAFTGEITPRSRITSPVGFNNIGTGRTTLILHGRENAMRSPPPEFDREAVEASFCDQAAVQKVMELLESYMGIKDQEFASSIVDVLKGKTDLEEFMTAFDDEFGAFGFPQDFVFDVWGYINDAKEYRPKTMKTMGQGGDAGMDELNS